MAKPKYAISRYSSNDTQIGFEEHIVATLTYSLGWVSGLALFIMESENERVRFHAVQSIVIFGSIFILSSIINIFQSVIIGLMSLVIPWSTVITGLVTFIFNIANVGLSLFTIILWAYLLFHTYNQREPRIPYVANIANKYS